MREREIRRKSRCEVKIEKKSIKNKTTFHYLVYFAMFALRESCLVLWDFALYLLWCRQCWCWRWCWRQALLSLRLLFCLWKISYQWRLGDWKVRYLNKRQNEIKRKHKNDYGLSRRSVGARRHNYTRVYAKDARWICTLMMHVKGVKLTILVDF